MNCDWADFIEHESISTKLKWQGSSDELGGEGELSCTVIATHSVMVAKMISQGSLVFPLSAPAHMISWWDSPYKRSLGVANEAK